TNWFSTEGLTCSRARFSGKKCWPCWILPIPTGRPAGPAGPTANSRLWPDLCLLIHVYIALRTLHVPPGNRGGDYASKGVRCHTDLVVTVRRSSPLSSCCLRRFPGSLCPTPLPRPRRQGRPCRRS